MGRDSYYPQSYKCECGIVSKHYVWASTSDEAQHECTCGKELNYTHEYEELIGEAPGIKTPTKSHPMKIRKERTKRAQEHFKKEIQPTFKPGSTEFKHFNKKYGKS